MFAMVSDLYVISYVHQVQSYVHQVQLDANCVRSLITARVGVETEITLMTMGVRAKHYMLISNSM